MSEMFYDKVLISKSTMRDIADAIRKKTETTNVMKASDMPSLIESVTTEDIITCVDNGFVVNFYNDENKIIQANSTVCGMLIDTPISYECAGWKNSEETIVELPITSNNAGSVINLYPIFLEYEDYSVVLADYPITYELLSAEGQFNEYEVKYYTDGYYSMSVLANDVTPDDNSDLITAGLRATVANLPTNSNNKMRVKYTTNSSGYMWINEDTISSGNEIKLPISATNEYLTFDVTGDTVDLYIRVGSNSTTIRSVLTISEIYFYHE